MLDYPDDNMESQPYDINSNPYNLNTSVKDDNLYGNFNNETIENSTNDTFITAFNKSHIFDQLNKIGDGTQNFKNLHYNAFMKSFNQLTNEEQKIKTKTNLKKKTAKVEKLFEFSEDNTIEKDDIFSEKSSKKNTKVKTKVGASSRRKPKVKVKELYHYSKIK